ncbi:5-formyltetrahydrofolate cyclo-ligase [Flagellimonas lutaonensis]|uniref:5-formyltetrahydrofolate cyclo-ligase n=1 Tax=Flagellimonas lutaonensis TaxID=516051 RepID=A0A0D5YSD2_9FLAO|nr:5-formyltetrahydrofolate cyclo-ligase [Allomuricauda lutaonensis]AKA34824.1 5-formyltetrahydrofolate cyclo-ligase [Allomuricauda lutaonensis]
MLKHELRKVYKEKRLHLSPSFILEHSIEIANRLLQLPIWHFTHYHVFLSIADKKEVDTHPIITTLQARDKCVVVPKIASGTEMEHYLLTDSTKLVLNSWQIPEPVDGIKIEASKIDVIFMPLLAFDLMGNRVGYGKGYYDTFLKKCRQDSIKIGVSFFGAEEVISDVGPHDVPLDYCVTPTKIYSFPSSDLSS